MGRGTATSPDLQEKERAKGRGVRRGRGVRGETLTDKAAGNAGEAVTLAMDMALTLSIIIIIQVGKEFYRRWARLSQNCGEP